MKGTYDFIQFFYFAVYLKRLQTWELLNQRRFISHPTNKKPGINNNFILNAIHYWRY